MWWFSALSAAPDKASYIYNGPPQCVYINLNFVSCLPQKTKGYEFESETDTEVIPKLIKYVYDNRESDNVSFSTLVERVIQQLVSISNTAKHDLQHRLLPPQKHTTPFNTSPGNVNMLISVFLA